MTGRSLLRPLRDAVAAGELSAVSLTERALARIAAQGELNAVVAVERDGALAQAAAIDRAARAGRRVGPLAGLPVLVKDVEDMRGLPTICGSILRRDAPPATADAAVPARLRAAGGVLIGKTNVPELGMDAYTTNRVFGLTHNPWRRGVAPGGSSGGSAAALAAGLAAVATASDGGGSTRIPAALCGLVAIKPTSGVIPQYPVRLPMDVSGPAPLANTTADLARLLRVIAAPYPLVRPLRRRPARWPRRLLTSERVVGAEPLPETVQAAFADAVGRLAGLLELGSEPLGRGSVFDGDVYADWAHAYAPVGARDLTPRELAGLDQLTTPVREWVGLGLSTSWEEHLEGSRRRYEHIRRLDALLRMDAVLVSPTLAVDRYRADGILPGRTEPDMPTTWFNTAAFNFTGHPAASVPAGAIDGVPFGLQIVAPRMADWWLLDLAARWEAAYPWPLTAPGYTPLASA
jgi:amidase/aspartyl-tRNA(Asn)/glutamyl-tRNA(Gln) amidotransferase subunit A